MSVGAVIKRINLRNSNWLKIQQEKRFSRNVRPNQCFSKRTFWRIIYKTEEGGDS